MVARWWLWESCADEALVLTITKRRQGQRQWGCAYGTLAPMVARQRQWQRQWGGRADGTLALLVARRGQWQRQSKGCTGDALAMMEGCTNEAFALMIARRRQWRKEVRRMHGWCSRNDGRMRRRSSCIDDRGMKAVAKGVKRMHRRSSRANRRMRRRSSRTNGHKTKLVRRLRRWSTHTNGRETRDSGMDALIRLTNLESRGDKRTAVLESVRRQDKKDKMIDSLETEAWLTQYQLLWPWLTQHQLLWPAQSKSRGSKNNNNKKY